MPLSPTKPLVLALLILSLAGCARLYSVSVNDQPVYDPTGRNLRDTVADADLQGCINLAVRQQNLTSPQQLTVLSCAGSGVTNLDNISELQLLRFLDLGSNGITNLTPLEGLIELGGLNLANNRISDIRPLFNIPGLTSVSLQGNNGIPCEQLTRLRAKLGNRLTAPASCSP